MKKIAIELKTVVRGTAASALLLTAPLALGQPGGMQQDGMMQGEGMEHGGGMSQNQGVRRARGQGEVISLGEGAGQIKLRHAPMPELDWPAMTMTFEVEDPAMLEGLKEGEQISFEVRLDPGGQPTITSIK